ncbi:MAG TPA: 3-methyladenine DNA glycosylase [Nocardioidaceae bacterium]|nr:3-methyladenine DNA glycosylase [Nocardioidaceae bacterium]
MDTLPSPAAPLGLSAWSARREAHEERVDAWLLPHLERRARRVAHPVEDFLFTYYSQRPAALRRWHPGFGVRLADGTDYVGLKGYDVRDETATVTRDHVVSQRPLLAATRALLAATAGRPPQLACFGLHEWAMVYRQSAPDVRHGAGRLRLGSAGTDEVVESHRISCSHFDAFRFFTAEAAPRNALKPGSADRSDFEQPGCLHAGMDLYKLAFRLTPMVCSELVADCFELAREIRVLDMRASPYDLSDLGHEPVRVETAAGKAEYVEAQRAFAIRAAPLRAALLAECDRLLAVR